MSKIAWVAAFGVLGMGCPAPESRDAGTRVDTGTAIDTGTVPSDTGTAPSDTGVRPNDTGMVAIDTGVRPMDTGVDTGTTPPDAGSDAGSDAGRDGGTDAFTACTVTQYRNASGVCTALTVCDPVMQYESTAATATSDRACTALTVCSGTQYQSTAPTATSDRTCTALTVCTASQYQSVAPTPTSNRVCTAVTTCNPATQYQTAAPTTTSDRVCAALTVCTASQYQTVAPTPTTNRVCAALTDCSAGQFVSTPPTATTNRACSPCGANSFSATTNAASCTAWTTCNAATQYESTAPTAARNRVCTALTVCTAAQYQTTAPTATSDRVCTALTNCAAGSFQSTAPTPTTNRACTACAAGTFSATTNALSCTAWAANCVAGQFQATAPSSTVNRVCTGCAAGTFSTVTNAALCTPWTSCVAPDVQLVAGTASADRRCGPANDLPGAAVTINMSVPASTFTVDTTNAQNHTTTGSCTCTSGNDVFYNFTIPAGAPELIYADTLGSSFDTSLFVQTSAGVNVTNLLPGGVSCNNDGGLSGCGTGTRSQILLRLDPGSYRLVLSGCAAGAATLNFQHLPIGNGTLTALALGSSSPMGTTSGTGRVTQSCTNALAGTGPENTYYWYSCGSFAGGGFSASTCAAASYDTVLEQRSARTAARTCNDDGVGCTAFRAAVVTTVPAGAGIHTLYVDGFNGAAGTYTVNVIRP